MEIIPNAITMATSTIKPSVRKAEITYVNAINVDNGGVRLVKDPNTQTVRAFGYFRKATNIPVNTVLFRVPEGFRPPFDYAIPMYLKTDSATGAYFGKIAANGEISESFGATVREGFFAGEWEI